MEEQWIASKKLQESVACTGPSCRNKREDEGEDVGSFEREREREFSLQRLTHVIAVPQATAESKNMNI